MKTVKQWQFVLCAVLVWSGSAHMNGPTEDDDDDSGRDSSVGIAAATG